MSTLIARALRQPAGAGPVAPQPQRGAAAGPEARPARDHSKPKAVGARGSASPIRAWRADDGDPPQASQQRMGAAAIVASPGSRHPFGGEGGSGPRRSSTDRAARMRAIEQAWKDEHARQADLEND